LQGVYSGGRIVIQISIELVRNSLSVVIQLRTVAYFNLHTLLFCIDINQHLGHGFIGHGLKALCLPPLEKSKTRGTFAASSAPKEE
jgi:hypothetical protein